MMTFPACFDCKHFWPGQGMKCEAFPQGIPDAILFSKTNHREPYPGDHGIQFEAKEPTAPISQKNKSTK